MRLFGNLRLRGRVLAIAVALGVSGVLYPATSEAVTVTLGGFNYELTVLPAGQSFNAADAAANLSSTPWWGNGTLTNNLANAYAAVVSPLAAPVRFAYAEIFNFLAISYQVGTSGAVALNVAFSGATGGSAFVTGTRTPVPEIDGPVLSRLALIVGTLYLALHLYRRKKRLV